MSVLITGGTGLIGGHTMRALLQRGEKVIAYDAFPATEHVDDILQDITIVKGDITDLSDLIRVIKEQGVDRIAHLASLLTPDAQKAPMTAYRVILGGTMNVLEAARILDIRRIVFASSIAVYGETPGGPFNEDHPKNPTNIYGALKIAAEHIGMNYYRDYSVDFVALRFPLVYGRGGVRGFRYVEEIVGKCARKLTARIPQSDFKWELVYGPDAGDAVSRALYASPSQLEHRAFNIGSGELYSFPEVAEIFREIMPEAKIELTGGYSSQRPTRGIFDLSRARDELGYEPKYGVRVGMRDFLNEVMARI